MNKLIAVAAIAIVTACSKPATQEPEATAEPAAATAPNEGPGTFEVTYADGSTGSVTTTAEGTFTANRGEESAAGTVTQADGKICFDAEGDEEGATCWTNSEPGEDGSWSSTSDDGETVTVRRAAA